ncbi:hypothetical protein GCM10010977_17580 [Citricoccus zhacaiensis]|uniref:Uncharacterized protein n=1 Tax=Citricoccus zhacaiensis TaxID=489142 RepID=A0ABQ2LZA8_9MICC|nr:hypothetical protein [Citricoccus zhacaiensis]GGO45254.1 hypothetical protein GCM10010977_17580 [Citricoccus zhacaiensis]
MATPLTRTVSRRTWRASVAVFLVVFLGGLGVSGASALWSQQASAKTTVATGTWVKEGWSMPLNVDAHLQDFDTLLVVAEYDFRFTWNPRQAEYAQLPLRYEIALTPVRNGRVMTNVPSSVNGDQRDISVTVLRQGLKAEFKLTITPVLDGVRGTPTTKTLEVLPFGDYRFSS